MKKLNKAKKVMALIKGNRMFVTLVAMLILFNMVVVTSVAWLTMNRETDADQMGMALAVDDTTAVYKAYMYDLSKGEGTDMINETTALNITNIVLNPYDTIFQGQNIYTPVFARIELVGNKSMPKSGTVHITVERDPDISDAKYSSSVLRFTALVIPEKGDLSYTTANALYNFINSSTRFDAVEKYTEQMDHSKNFVVSVTGTGENLQYTKTDSLTVSVSYTEDDWYVEENANILYVYLYMTYDATLIANYMSSQEAGGGVSLEDNTVLFENDLTRIRVSYTGNGN